MLRNARAAVVRNRAVRPGAHHSPRYRMSFNVAIDRSSMAIRPSNSIVCVSSPSLAPVNGVLVRMCRNSGAALSSRKAPSDCRMVSLVRSAPLFSACSSIRYASGVPTWRIARSASRCTPGSLSSSMVRKSGSAASPPRARSRSTAARRTAGLRELRSSFAYSRAAGPNEIRMSRRRRTVFGLSSPMIASDIGFTSTGPIVLHIFLAMPNSVSVALCRKVARCRTIGPSTSFFMPADAGSLNVAASSCAMAAMASSSCSASVRSPTCTSASMSLSAVSSTPDHASGRFSIVRRSRSRR